MKSKIQSRLMLVFLSLIVCMAFIPTLAFAGDENTNTGANNTTVNDQTAPGGTQVDPANLQPNTPDQGGTQVDPANPGGDSTNPNAPDQNEQENPKVKYTITFDPNGGQWKDSTEKLEFSVPELGEIIFPEAPTREGYTFLGWGEFKIKPGTKEVIVFGDKTFKAMWQKNEVTPNTGDNATLYLYTFVLLSAGAMLVLNARRNKKEQ